MATDVADPAPILLLDLRKEARGFFQAENLHDAAERLVADGFDVRLVRSVATLRGDDWSLRIACFVADVNPRAVVVERLWDEDLVGLLRDGGRQVVRLDDGHETALDGHYDAILGEDALVDWLRGSSTPERARSLPTTFLPTTRELRARKDAWQPTSRKLRFDVLEDPDNELAIGRAVVRGPAEGCPFLLDARRNPVFADLQMDGMQHRGCTFCLDNLGAFAMPAGDAVIDAWMAGIIDARRADPGLREVVLADERPHPNLPALFSAIADHDQLAGLAILIKTRVDWLLEFADTALTEALTIAADSGLQLHVYLVGFESFEPFHLQLFNKGVTVADNVAAIACLARLQDAFPKAFEYRRYRAHGIVLFTPWTTPEHLLAGAQVMHETGFSALRSGAWRTRLRIHPGLPLHALALRDGLTDTTFPERRPDRAREQGYNASIPWRFADPRTALAFAILQDVAWRLERRIDEALVIGIVAAFAAAHPELADRPDFVDIAHLPLLAALIACGPRVADADWSDVVGLASDPNLLRLRDDPSADPFVVRREPLPFSSTDLAVAYEAMGWSAVAAGERGDVVVVARDQAGLDEGLRRLATDRDSRHENAQRPTADVMKTPRLDGAINSRFDNGPIGLADGLTVGGWAPVLRGIELQLRAALVDDPLRVWVLPLDPGDEPGDSNAWTSTHHALAHQRAPAGWSGPTIDNAMQHAVALVIELEEEAAAGRNDTDTDGLPSLPRRQDEALVAIAARLGIDAFEPAGVHAHWRWQGLTVDLHGGRLVMAMEGPSGARFDVIGRRRGEMDRALAQSRWLDLAHADLPSGLAGVEAHAAIDALAVELVRREEASKASLSASAKDRKEPDDHFAGGVDEFGAPLEKLAFRIGLKPVLRIERVPFSRWQQVAADVAHGHAEVGNVRYDGAQHGRVDDPEGALVDVFIGHDRACAQQAVKLDACEKVDGDEDATRELGRLLGYPDCCVDAFLRTHNPGDNTDWPRTIAARSGPGPWSWVVSALPVERILLPFMPCRFDCPDAVAWGARLAEALAEEDGALHARVKAAHQRVFSYRDWRDFEPVVAEVEGRVDAGDGVVLDFTKRM